MRWVWLFLVVPSMASAQAVIVTDSTKWVHAVAVGTPWTSGRMTLAPGQTLAIRYQMLDAQFHPPVELAPGPGIWSTNNPTFVVEGVGGLATVQLATGFVVGDSARVFVTLSTPRATRVVPEIAVFLFVDLAGVYECRGTAFPNLAMWGWGDLQIHFQSSKHTWDCRVGGQEPLPSVPTYPNVIEAEALGTGPWYDLAVRVMTQDGEPVVGAVLAFEIVNGEWGNETTTTRACSTNAEGICASTNRFQGTVRVSLPDDKAAAVEVTAIGGG